MKNKILIFVLLMLASAVYAEIKLPSVISDNMVLQADTNVPIWGKAEPNSKITVLCSWNDSKVSADSDTQGKWAAKIKTPKSGRDCKITLSCGQESKTIQNILIGEVWLCSGQSNMWWPLKDAMDANEEIATAHYPDMRLFTVPMGSSKTPLDDCKGKWVSCSSETVKEFSAVGYFFGREIHNKLNVPVGLIFSSNGGTPVQAWTKREVLEADNEFKKCLEKDAEVEANKTKYQQQYDLAVSEWNKASEAARVAGKKAPKKPGMPRELFDKTRSAVLYNAMIHPVIPFGIKGVIWYQGESNVEEPELYGKLFPAMIKNWRDDWGQGDFPFYYVQIASYGKYMKKTGGMPDLSVPTDSNWARLREAQLKTLSLANTGMAVTIDIGDVTNIHPKNKTDVGKRLALWALAKDYGCNIVYSGPLYKKYETENDKIRIYFEHANLGLIVKGKEIKGFAVAGTDKKFVWAKAEIQGDTVLVWADGIKKPTAIRYGWADWSNCNLYNKEGFPASTFRTDNW
jgi:sialate O-acetylesterase